MALEVVASLVSKLVERKRCNLGVRAGSAGQGLGFCRVQLGESSVEHSYLNNESQQCYNHAAMLTKRALGLFRFFREKVLFGAKRIHHIYALSAMHAHSSPDTIYNAGWV
jgi:hypothetical protein